MTAYVKVLVLVLESQIVVAIKQVLRRKMTLLGMYPDIYDLCLQQVWYLYVEIWNPFTIVWYTNGRSLYAWSHVLTNKLFNNSAMMMNFMIVQRRNLVRNPMSSNQLRLLIVFWRKRIASAVILKVKRNCLKKRSISWLRAVLQILGMTLMLTWVAYHLN